MRMKLLAICAILGSLAILVVTADETKKFLEGLGKIVQAAQKANGALNTETEMAIGDFVTTNGKVRVCQYFEVEWKKVNEKLSKIDGILKKTCDDSNQGDKELIQVFKELFKTDQASKT